jgi:hypothetical protein
MIEKRSPPAIRLEANEIKSQERRLAAVGDRGCNNPRKPRLFDSALGMEKKQTFEMEVSKVR